MARVIEESDTIFLGSDKHLEDELLVLGNSNNVRFLFNYKARHECHNGVNFFLFLTVQHIGLIFLYHSLCLKWLMSGGGHVGLGF